MEGDPKQFLPLVHYALLRSSHLVAQWISENGYELMGKSDARFIEGAYKFLRKEFNYHPSLTIAQFFAVGYAERKAILLSDMIRLCKEKHNELEKKVDVESKKKAVK
jgi:hypothetical protein